MKILIVDDELIIREWLQMTIANLLSDSTSVDTATDGVDALSCIEQKHYDVAFVDIQMPRMDGLELIQQIRAKDTSMILVILTSHNQFDYARKAVKYDAFEYLLKNECTKEHLQELLQRCQDTIQSRIATAAASQASLFSVLNQILDAQNPAQYECAALYDSFQQSGCRYFFSFACDAAQQLQREWLAYPDLHIYPLGVNGEYQYYLVQLRNSLSEADCLQYPEDFIKSLLLKSPALRLGYSSLAKAPAALADSLQTTQASVRHLFYLEQRSCKLSNRLQYHEEIAPIMDAYVRILKAIKKYDNSSILAEFRQLQAFIQEKQPSNVDFIKERYAKILSILMFHYTQNMSTTSEDSDQIFKQILCVSTYSELLEIVSAACRRSILLQNSTFSHSVHIEKALSFIASNYRAVSSVKEVADYLHLNPNYLSKLFKEEVGDTLVNYIMDYKLCMASYMLKDSECTVQDIAQRVGIGNLSYFSKKFKELYGVQPKHYRTQLHTPSGNG